MKKKSLFSYLTKELRKGKNESRLICSKFGLLPNFNFYLLDKNKLKKFKNIQTINFKSLYKNERVKLLSDLPSFRGVRHNLFLPVNGQKTHNNSKTRRKYKIS